MEMTRYAFWTIIFALCEFLVVTDSSAIRKRTAAAPMFLNWWLMDMVDGVNGIATKNTIYYENHLDINLQGNLQLMTLNGDLVLYGHDEYSTNETFRNVLYANHQELPPLSLDDNKPIFSSIIEGNSARGISQEFIEGDIIIPNTVPIVSPPSSRRNDLKKRSSTPFSISGQLWGTTVPYQFEINYPSTSQTKVRDAMDTIEASTCLSFAVKQPTDVDYLSIGALGGCSSAIGKHGGAQLLSLDNYCVSPEGIIIHELFHALGLHHTHSRLDRNSYVTVNTGNVDTGDLIHFDLYGNEHSDPFSLEYDFKSVMHYGTHDYSKNTLSVLDPANSSATIGQRTGASYLDFTHINLMYGCYDKTPHHWPMDEMNTETDKIIGTTEITAPTSGGTGFKLGLDIGQRLSCLRLKTTDAYANLGSHPGKCVVDPESCSNGFSAMFWFKVADASVNPMHLLSSQEWQPVTAVDRGFNIKFDNVDSSQRIEVHYQKKDACRYKIGFGTFTSWTHVAITYSSTNDLKLYIDGVVDVLPAFACETTTNVPDDNPTLIIGKMPDLSSSDDVDLYMDDVVIWEKEVDSTEVSNIKSGGPYHDKPVLEGSYGLRNTVVGTVSSYTAL